MAEKDKLDLGEEKKPSSMKKIIFIVLGSILVTLLIVGAALYFLGIFPSKGHADGGSKGGEAAKEKPVEPVAVLYESLQPSFVVNFKPNPEARMAQVELSVAAHDQSVIDAVKKHLPIIRNNLLLLLGLEDPARLKTGEGKEALRKKIRDEINTIVKKQAKLEQGIDDVFFTGFIMQ